MESTQESASEAPSDAQGQPFFAGTDASELLDLLVDEAAASLSLLSEFQLGEPVAEDTVEHEPPGMDGIQVVFRVGFQVAGAARMGLLGLPLPEILTLAGSLLMLPTESIRSTRGKGEPDEGEKEAIMEAGNLIGGAFDAALRKRVKDPVVAKFFGCQGVAAGEAPWISAYGGEPLAVRRHQASFAGFEDFTVLLAIPT